MANYVYSTITINETENWDRLKKIVEVGIAEFYKPMPKALDIDSPQYKEDEVLIANNNLKRYGASDWYDWRNQNHGTKWGDYGRDLNGDNLCFVTAWSPLAFDIIEMFVLDFPNITYQWEEEQGFGERYEFKDGELVEEHKWDIPMWADNETLSEEDQGLCYENDIGWLSKEYHKMGETFKVGFYHESELEDFIGATIEEVKKDLEDI